MKFQMVIVVVMGISSHFYNKNRTLIGKPEAIVARDGSLWIGDSRRSMFGLWSLDTVPLGLTLHVAFEVTMNDLLDAPIRLKAQGITPISFFGIDTMEPSVIGWMPAAALYFRDPDGHLIEYFTML